MKYRLYPKKCLSFLMVQLITVPQTAISRKIETVKQQLFQFCYVA